MMIDSNPAQLPTATRHGPASPTTGALRPLPLDAVRLDPAALLGGWQERNARATIPHCVGRLETSGALGNLRGDRPHVGMWFSDSDVYKTLEAVAWQHGRAPGDTGFFDAVVDLLDRTQDADGYLDSFFQHGEPGRRWQDLSTSHELYCAGHLIQAAVAASRASLGTRLMDIARRFADLIVARFGPDGQVAVCGHPEIETALVELYRVTGHRPYLEVARLFVERRGHGLLGDGLYGAAYFQDHRPVREADEFTGHAVRQLYLLAGVVDVAVETGDAELLGAAERLWESAFGTKTYLTGAHGSRHRDEAVGDPYELPPDRAYAETCAAIGSFQWNWRLLLATGNHRYADEMERVLHNAIAGSTALDGEHFFYSNPLQLRTGHDGTSEDVASQRLPWYSCACCPPNLARLMASLQCYLATTDDTGVQLHLYAAGTVHTGQHTVTVRTGYPWDGGIVLTVSSTSVAPWTLALRVPAWCDFATLEVDGVPMAVAPVDGYLRLTRSFSTAVTVRLGLSMPARLVAPHPRVDAVRGCVALARGPLVYSVEQADLPVALEDVTIDPGAPVHVAVHDSGAPVRVSLAVPGRFRDSAGEPLYASRADATNRGTPLTVTAIPYFLWGNREPGPMRVWLPLSTGD